jgi:hypothetical protein
MLRRNILHINSVFSWHEKSLSRRHFAFRLSNSSYHSQPHLIIVKYSVHHIIIDLITNTHFTDEIGQYWIANQQPSSWRHPVSLVLKFLRPNFVKVFETKQKYSQFIVETTLLKVGFSKLVDNLGKPVQTQFVHRWNFYINSARYFTEIIWLIWFKISFAKTIIFSQFATQNMRTWGQGSVV